MINRLLFLLLSFIAGVTINIYSQAYTPADPEYYAMDRQQVRFDDYQLLLFNSRGFAAPRQYSMTGFTNVQFLPVNAPFYNFYLNLKDNRTGKIIQDDVPQTWESRNTGGRGYDPLSANFRPNSPFVFVTQDEKWQPNSYFRSGTFHKELEGKWISFSMKTVTSVSNNSDEVFLQVIMYNRKPDTLNMTFIPRQFLKSFEYDGDGVSDSSWLRDAFTLENGPLRITVSSNIKMKNKDGFEFNILPGQTDTLYFAVKFYPAKENIPDYYQPDIKTRMLQAQQFTRNKLKWAYNTLPVLESSDIKLKEYYYRCMLSVLMCRYENPNFLTNPFWTVGTWPFTISWDNSYTADVLAMLDAKSLKEAILTDLRNVNMKRTYVSWKGAFWDNIYIQEPFALQVMIEAYIRHTNDYSIFNDKAGDASVWEWMKKWITELKTNYTNKNGLIDIGYDTQKIIEIRTDGYNHVVPVLNILTTNLLYRMSEWGKVLNDPVNESYFKDADNLKELTNKNLWNEKEGWFDNLYPDGTKEAVWTLHLYDALGTSHLLPGQVNKLISHIKEGVFLGKYGVYSIARKDTIHWDMIDSDWGGGGQYCGMPGRLSRYLFQQGFGEIGWDILKRNMRYIDYFPYLPQNPKTDSPEQDRSSMPLEISAGAGIEAIVFGVFGISSSNNKITFNPCRAEGTGEISLKNFSLRGSSFDVYMHEKTYDIYINDKFFASNHYGVCTSIELPVK
jgi:hypothetical protein